MKENCPFCKINLEKTRVISESKNILVLLSNPALYRGHCLVVPKRHLENIKELNNNEKKEIFLELIKVEDLLLKKFSGVDIRQNFRPFLSQGRLKVDHLYFHLIPREFEDVIYTKSQIFEKEIFKDLDSNDLNNTKNLILN